ncbi:MAG: fructose-bisphosphate aldolase, class [Thauera sp.]|nr:fructose-bisphosphate aldolase, class [Thauera sp.]
MPLVSMRQLLDHAAEHSYGLPAFNVNNLEQVQAIMEAAAECDSPVIMQASAGARKLQRDDGRLADGRRQDALLLRVQRRRHP